MHCNLQNNIYNAMFVSVCHICAMCTEWNKAQMLTGVTNKSHCCYRHLVSK